MPTTEVRLLLEAMQQQLNRLSNMPDDNEVIRLRGIYNTLPNEINRILADIEEVDILSLRIAENILRHDMDNLIGYQPTLPEVHMSDPDSITSLGEGFISVVNL